MLPTRSALACSLALSLVLPAQSKHAADQNPAERIQELNRMLDRIERGLKSHIRPDQVEERLRARTPRYRTIRIRGAGNPAAGAAAGDTEQPASRPAPKSRLLGDAEKATLPPETVMVVNGMPVRQDEVEALAAYLATYDGAAEPRERLRQATAELIKVKAVQAEFKDRLPDLQKRIEQYHAEATKPGADFAAVAKAHSECPSRDAGGDLGEFGRSGMVIPFARWAFTLPVGKVSPVFATEFGYHFLEVTGKQKGTTPAESMARASHVLVMYSREESRLRELAAKASGGGADVAVLDAKWRDNLPAVYR